MDSIRIAAVSCESRFGEIDRNLDTVERWAARLQEQDVNIACFPELGVSGYSLAGDIRRGADSIPGDSTVRLEHIARLYNMVVIAGLSEATARGYYISHAVVTPERFDGQYRKIHLSPEEQKHYFPGKETAVFHWRGFRFGVGLCFDAHFPELATAFALKGADIIFYAHASPRPETAREKYERWLRYLPARAYDNSVYVAACNQSGTNGKGLDFKGVSLICDPKGIVVGNEISEGECAAIADVRRSELESVRGSSMGYFLKQRVPSAYDEIVKKREP